jgi:hypothetical protein
LTALGAGPQRERYQSHASNGELRNLETIDVRLAPSAEIGN